MHFDTQIPDDWFRQFYRAEIEARIHARIIPCIDYEKSGDEVIGFVFAYKYGGASDITVRTKEECGAIQKKCLDELSRLKDIQKKVHAEQAREQARLEEYQARLEKRREREDYLRFNNLRGFIKMDSRRRTATLSDGYVRRVLCLPKRLAPPALIEAKRTQLKIKRALKEIR